MACELFGPVGGSYLMRDEGPERGQIWTWVEADALRFDTKEAAQEMADRFGGEVVEADPAGGAS